MITSIADRDHEIRRELIVGSCIGMVAALLQFGSWAVSPTLTFWQIFLWILSITAIALGYIRMNHGICSWLKTKRRLERLSSIVFQCCLPPAFLWLVATIMDLSNSGQTTYSTVLGLIGIGLAWLLYLLAFFMATNMASHYRKHGTFPIDLSD